MIALHPSPEHATWWTAMVGPCFSEHSEYGKETASNGPKVVAREREWFWCSEVLAASANPSRCNLNA